eukprot:6910490-Alexandrium_andersonii.AAC.1
MLPQAERALRSTCLAGAQQARSMSLASGLRAMATVARHRRRCRLSHRTPQRAPRAARTAP